MSELDNSSNIWLKLNLIRSYKDYHGLNPILIKDLINSLYKQLDFKNNKKLYEINVIINYMGSFNLSHHHQRNLTHLDHFKLEYRH